MYLYTVQLRKRNRGNPGNESAPSDLHERLRNGLHYFATDDSVFYVVQRDPIGGLVYRRSNNLGRNGDVSGSIPINKSFFALFTKYKSTSSTKSKYVTS